MNNNKTLLVPICIFTSIVIFLGLILLLVKEPIAEYQELTKKEIRQDNEFQNLEKRIGEIQTAQEQEELQLKSIKHIYEAKNNSTDNLSVFGNLFDDIINLAQSNKLLIRSIEYDMNPTSDPILAEYSDIYNVCELKFFLVGTYEQFQAFLAGINNNFDYLTSLSKINITTFQANTDYLLINFGITLYSKKPAKQN